MDSADKNVSKFHFPKARKDVKGADTSEGVDPPAPVIIYTFTFVLYASRTIQRCKKTYIYGKKMAVPFSFRLFILFFLLEFQFLLIFFYYGPY